MASESGRQTGDSGEGGQDRRSGQERRVPTDRRQADQPVESENRREGDRRAGGDRRTDDRETKLEQQPDAAVEGEFEDDDDRRTGLDRREDSDRRTGDDRRQRDEDITFPDRRKSTRRSSGERRTTTGRRVEDDEIPTVDWFKEEREASRRRERKRRVIAALIFVGALIPAGIIHLYFKYRTPPPPPPPREQPRVTARPDPFKNVQTRRRKSTRRTTTRKQAEIDRRLAKIEQLREDILSIAPDKYSSVRLQLVSGRYVDETNLEAEEELTVRAIQIHVISDQWDAMTSAEKIKLLQTTYSMLRARYPALTQFVTLRFDDGRKDLDLRFDDEDMIVR